MNALIGYTGFVGSHLIQEGMDLYNRSNLADLSGKVYDTLYCSALPAEKWRANLHPAEDRLNMERLMDALRTVRCTTFVLISTVDVLQYSNQPYGAHRREFEEWVSRTFDRVFIVRLPALFGHGLKKNALYDMMHGNNIHSLRSHWVFHWYNVEWVWDDIQAHIAADHRIVNLLTPALALSEVQTLLFPEIHLSSEATPAVHYDIPSEHGYTRSRDDLLRSMAEYVRHVDRLTVSEVGWNPEKDSVMMSYLRSKGITRREIVPSKRNWTMDGYHNVYSAQSILYGVDIQIFQEQERFLSILSDRVAKLSSVGAKVIVFGSPKQRVYSGEDAVALFRRVGDLCQNHGITLCVENNARGYGGNWLHTASDTIAFVKSVNHPNIRVNLDTGSMMMENESTVVDTEWIGHVQVSFPALGPWRSDSSAHDILRQLQDYTGVISLEMLQVDFRSIDNFVKQDWFHLKHTGNLSA